MIYKHAGLQFGVVITIFTLWAATDTWFLITGFSISAALNVVVGAAAGFVITSVIHEWAHFVGAKVSGARYSVPCGLGLFVYDFDFEANNLRQFNVMSVFGQLGSWLSVVLLWQAIPMDTPGRVMLVGGAVSSAVFAGMIEIPVLRRSQASGDPLRELSRIDPGVLRRSALGGIGAGLLVWYLAG